MQCRKVAFHELPEDLRARIRLRDPSLLCMADVGIGQLTIIEASYDIGLTEAEAGTWVRRPIQAHSLGYTFVHDEDFCHVERLPWIWATHVTLVEEP